MVRAYDKIGEENYGRYSKMNVGAEMDRLHLEKRELLLKVNYTVNMATISLRRYSKVKEDLKRIYEKHHFGIVGKR
jgi:hypothetical protein